MDFLLFQVRIAIVGNYKPDRLYGRGEKYGDAVIASAFKDVNESGQFHISHHESKSGEPITFKLDGAALVLQEIS